MKLSLDFETACDLDLKKVGVARYTRHPSFRILLTAWAIDDGEVQQVEGPPPVGLFSLVDTIHAFNAPFEIACLRTICVFIDPRRWRCTMAHAYARGFTGQLKDVGQQVGLPEDQQKLADGGRLIGWFCVQQKDDRGERWERFKLYNRTDVVAERAISERLDAWAPWTEEEQQLWMLDQEINDYGVPVDVPLVRNAQAVAEAEKADLERRCVELTGLKPSQTGALLAWCRGHGYPGDNLQRETIANYLEATR